MWDIGGQDALRVLWYHYYENTEALIFVIDSNDRERMDKAKEELHKMLTDEAMDKCKSVLILANK